MIEETYFMSSDLSLLQIRFLTRMRNVRYKRYATSVWHMLPSWHLANIIVDNGKLADQKRIALMMHVRTKLDWQQSFTL